MALPLQCPAHAAIIGVEVEIDPRRLAARIKRRRAKSAIVTRDSPASELRARTAWREKKLHLIHLVASASRYGRPTRRLRAASIKI